MRAILGVDIKLKDYLFNYNSQIRPIQYLRFKGDIIKQIPNFIITNCFSIKMYCNTPT